MTSDVEVWVVGGLQVNGFSGPMALQNAKDWCVNNPLPSGEYGLYVTAENTHWVGPTAEGNWVGPRPGRP